MQAHKKMLLVQQDAMATKLTLKSEADAAKMHIQKQLQKSLDQEQAEKKQAQVTRLREEALARKEADSAREQAD